MFFRLSGSNQGCFSLSGDVFNQFAEWVLWDNTTGLYYETWTVRDKPGIYIITYIYHSLFQKYGLLMGLLISSSESLVNKTFNGFGQNNVYCKFGMLMQYSKAASIICTCNTDIHVQCFNLPIIYFSRWKDVV